MQTQENANLLGLCMAGSEEDPFTPMFYHMAVFS